MTSFIHLVSLVEPLIDDEKLLARAHELEDLFRKCFANQKQITIERLILQSERRIYLEVCAQDHSGNESRVLIACGQKEQIVQEFDNFAQCVPKGDTDGYVRIGDSPRLPQDLLMSTLHFAAVPYTLVNANLDETVPSGEWYRGHPIEKVETAVRQLLTQLDRQWHTKETTQEEIYSWQQFYSKWLGLPECETDQLRKLQTQLTAKLESLCQKVSNAGIVGLNCTSDLKQVVVRLAGVPEDVYPNPADILFDKNKRRFDKTPAQYATTHGG